MRTRIALADQLVMPWANGGGLTRQVAVHPAAATTTGFLWRVSIASVASDGPFSRFDGVDRSLWLLRGAGLRLDVDGREVVLARPLQRLDFAGETPIAARLIDGPCEDLGVFTRRAVVRAHAQVQELADGMKIEAPAADQSLLLVLTGSLLLDEGPLATGDAMRADGTSRLVAAAQQPSRVLVCSFHLLC